MSVGPSYYCKQFLRIRGKPNDEEREVISYNLPFKVFKRAKVFLIRDYGYYP